MGRRVERGLLGACAAVVLVLGACQGGRSPELPGATSTSPPQATATTSTPPTSTVPPSTGPTSPTRRPTSSAPRPTPTDTAGSCPTRIPARLLGRDLTTLGTPRKEVALTFDGGSGNEAVGSILRTLDAEHVPASFFLTGEFVTAFPASARAIAARHQVGNHTDRHPDLTTLTSSAIRAEIRTAAARIKGVTGRDPHPWFRFPFGGVDARTISVVNEECYVPFRWTVDTLGWKGTSGGQTRSSVIARVTRAARPGEIVLMHLGAHPTDHSTLDADALPQVIAELRSRGYSFVALSTVIGPAP